MNFVLETHIEVGTGDQAQEKVKALMENVSGVLKDLGLANPRVLGDADEDVKSILVLRHASNPDDLGPEEWIERAVKDAVAVGIPVDGEE